MRPKHLRYPYPTIKESCPTVFVADRVWYAPLRGVAAGHYHFPGWQAPEFFGSQQPVKVEYCSGNGAWIAARAEQEPHVNWVAVEKKFERVKRVWAKIHNLGLKNLIVIYGEALQVTARYFPTASLAGVYINFPDPWPKRQHARHRLVAPPFVAELARCLEVGAAVTLVTDDRDYSEQAIQTFSAYPSFTSQFAAPYYRSELAEYGTSYFEELWRSKGCDIRYHIFSAHLQQESAG